MNRVVVIGSSNTDLVVTAPKIPAPGETVLGDHLLLVAGGKGANQAVAAARLGAQVTFVGKAGRDDFGSAAIANLAREQIDVRHFTQDPKAPSGVALITVDPKAENAIVVASGANLLLTQEDVDGAIGAIEQADVVLLQLESPLEVVRHAIRQVSRRDPQKVVILNPAPAPAQTLEPGFFEGVSILTPNETEAGMLTGIPVTSLESAAQAAEALHELGVPIAILTLGERGALVSLKRSPQEKCVQELIPAPRVQAIDTTAAGDVFSGALACALASQSPLIEAVQFACKAASISVTRRGAQSSVPSRHEL